MCGINGIIDYHKHYTKEERNSLVHRMNDKIIYRGPNMEGLFDSEYVTLGMRRLSIIDLSTGKQPIYNEKKTIAIVFNGEIYNFIQAERRTGGIRSSVLYFNGYRSDCSCI